VAVSLHQKGARLGSVLAFLVATPATSITALLVCYALLGIKFTAFISFAVIAMGLVMGLVGNLIMVKPKAFASQKEQLAIDPVCGMNVEIGKAAKTDYGGRLIIFAVPTASVPLVDAFVSQGMNIGAGMVLLLVGPVTSWGTILVLRKEFGGKTLLAYLVVIAIMALALGWGFSKI